MQMMQSASVWSLPTKFLASAVLSALGGAGVLSYLVEYATYSYALAYGFRPPVEGIPYLKTTVTAGSVFLLLSGAAIATTVLLTLRGALSPVLQARHPLSGLAGRFRSMGKVKATLIILSAAAFFGLLGYFFSPKLCDLVRTSECRDIHQARWIFSSCFALATALLMLLARLPAAIWWFVAGYTFLYYATIVTLIFTPTAYASFLRFTGFGGGVPVLLQLEEAKANTAPVERSAYLMLRTATAFVVFDQTGRRFEEYPLEEVHRLSYATGGMHRLAYQLPE